jgi:hypothetical protein
MLAASQQDLDRAEQDPAQLVISGGHFAHSGKLLHAYGLTSCARTTADPGGFPRSSPSPADRGRGGIPAPRPGPREPDQLR